MARLGQSLWLQDGTPNYEMIGLAFHSMRRAPQTSNGTRPDLADNEVARRALDAEMGSAALAMAVRSVTSVTSVTTRPAPTLPITSRKDEVIVKRKPAKVLPFARVRSSRAAWSRLR